MVFQFLTAQILIIGAIVVAKQMHFVNSQPLGFSKNNVVDIGLPENKPEQLKLLKDKLVCYTRRKQCKFFVRRTGN